MTDPLHTRPPLRKKGQRVTPHVDGPPVLQAAGTLHTRWRRAVQKAVAAARAEVLLTEVEAAARAGDEPRLLAALLPAVTVLQDKLAATLPLLLLEGFLAGGRAGAKALGALLHQRHAAEARTAIDPESLLQQRFDVTNPAAVAWARTHGAELITNITADQEAAVRDLVARGFTEHINPKDLAGLLKSTIGLTARQSETLAGLAGELAAAPPGSAVTIGSRTFRVPAEGATDKAFIGEALSDYADEQLDYRLEMIAVTETLAASAEGQRDSWSDAVDAGFLTGREQKGLIQVDPCPLCIAMAEEGSIGLDEEWSEGLPPFHPWCQCVEGIVSLDGPEDG
jgi:hypothetical protein